MKLINHDLKDKWILDSGATNHMTGNPELLNGTTCLVPSISVYLGNNEKLMATQIGSFKSPKISFPVLVVPGLNVNLISCAQLCADLECWIVLNGTGGFITTKEETSSSPSKLLKIYSSWSLDCNPSPDVFLFFSLRVISTFGIDD